MGVYKREQTWCIQYFANGKRRREAIGPSKREAENVLNKRKAEVREGRFFDLRKGDKLTFGEFLDRYLTEYSAHNKAPGTYRSDCLKASPLKAEFGDMRLTAVDTDVVHRYLARLREEGRAPATVNRYRALLSHIFTMAMRWGYVASNPVRLVKLLALIIAVNSTTKAAMLKVMFHELMLVLAEIHIPQLEVMIVALTWLVFELAKSSTALCGNLKLPCGMTIFLEPVMQMLPVEISTHSTRCLTPGINSMVSWTGS